MHPRYEMIELQRQIDELKKEYGRLSRRLELLEQKPKRGRPPTIKEPGKQTVGADNVIPGTGEWTDELKKQVNL